MFAQQLMLCKHSNEARLDVESKVHHIAIFNDVFLAF